MLPLAGVTFIQGDFREDAVLVELVKALDGRPVDLVISDMAPNLSGVGSLIRHGRCTWPNCAGVCLAAFETGRYFPGQSFSGRWLR